jgi:hypothetical protein
MPAILKYLFRFGDPGVRIGFAALTVRSRCCFRGLHAGECRAGHQIFAHSNFKSSMGSAVTGSNGRNLSGAARYPEDVSKTARKRADNIKAARGLAPGLRPISKLEATAFSPEFSMKRSRASFHYEAERFIQS